MYNIRAKKFKHTSPNWKISKETLLELETVSKFCRVSRTNPSWNNIITFLKIRPSILWPETELLACKFNKIKSVTCKQSAMLIICLLVIRCDSQSITCLRKSKFMKIDSQRSSFLYLVHIVSSNGNGSPLSINLKKTSKAIGM